MEPESGFVVPDLPDHAPRDGIHVDVGGGRDLPTHEHEPGGDEGLTGNVGVWVFLEKCIEDGVGDAIGDLVRVPFCDGLRREETFRHGSSLRSVQMLALGMDVRKVVGRLRGH
jgi:hypothetical protein